MRQLYRSARRVAHYVPIDIDGDAIARSALGLVKDYPGLCVDGIVADFERDLPWVPPPYSRRLVVSLGSTIGNLHPDARRALLRQVRHLLGSQDRFLVGLDLVKNQPTMEAAYNDTAGITVEFNRNILRVVNRALNANLRPEAFHHCAFYNTEASRIEMHLVPDAPQDVEVGDLALRVRILPGESIWTESSYKFTRQSVIAMLEEVGLGLEQWYTDDRAYIVRSGQIEIVKASSGREVLLSVRDEPGDIIGEMALLEHGPRTASVRARTDSELLAIRQEQFDHLLNVSSTAARAILQTVLGRWRATESMLRQSEKMAQLGTLTAGVAHELNNPAAAVRRGADQVLEAIARLMQAQGELARLNLTGEQRLEVETLTGRSREQATIPQELDALARSDRQYELEAWLERRGVGNAWELAPAMVDLDYAPATLESLAQRFSPDQLSVVIGQLSATYTVYNLLAEISHGAERISAIVKALKSYSYLDQAPVLAVDVHEGLDNTLLILRSKLKEGISVKREYAPDLPRIQAYGSELNQVWTNIIDNAADAMNNRGELIIRTYLDDTRVAVEIEDNGPGIPDDIQSRIFDPFFTTKPPGKGTGLGLDIAYNIVVYKHKGDIRVTSRPGRTCFQVLLPVNFGAA